MSHFLRIDPATGHLHLGDGIITPATTPADLGADVRLDEPRPVQVRERPVSCRFAHLSLRDGHLDIELSLRFEEERLVSLFISLNDPADSDDDFYAALPRQERLHRHWLTTRLGEQNDFPWGTAGVARDKSENIFIYLHNRNNGWAFAG